MIGCLRTDVCKHPIIVLYFESENVLKFYNLEASSSTGGGGVEQEPTCVLTFFGDIKVVFSL